ncbi:MAG: S1C family serine protease [Microthrixaceae bacterium]|nr:S1C family serine protease [Microthrixaceae bacterium]
MPNNYVDSARSSPDGREHIDHPGDEGEAHHAVPRVQGVAPSRSSSETTQEVLRGAARREMKRQSLGLGFTLNSEGYILTNFHVIENATEIIVTLSEDKKEYKATVVGQTRSSTSPS